MKSYAYYSHNGEISRVVWLPDGVVPSEIEGCKWVDLPSEIDPECHYFDGNKFFVISDKPSSYHVFDYVTKQWIDPRTSDTEWALVREERNRLLSASDWTQLPDVPLAPKEAWAIYRQALRDITLQQDPFNIVWPVPPSS